MSKLLSEPAFRLRGGRESPFPHSRDDDVLELVSDEEAFQALPLAKVMSPSRLTSFYAFVALGTLQEVRSVRSVRPGRYVVVHVPDVSLLVSTCCFFTRAELQKIGAGHHVRMGSKITRDNAYRELASHRCDSLCKGHYVLFDTMLNERVIPYSRILQHERIFRPQPECAHDDPRSSTGLTQPSTKLGIALRAMGECADWAERVFAGTNADVDSYIWSVLLLHASMRS